MNTAANPGVETDHYTELTQWKQRALDAERHIGKLQAGIEDLISTAAGAMQSANHGGSEYDIAEHLAEYRQLLNPPVSIASNLEQERNANRYLSLRRGSHWSVIDWKGDNLTGDVLDAAVDAYYDPRSGLVAAPAPAKRERCSACKWPEHCKSFGHTNCAYPTLQK